MLSNVDVTLRIQSNVSYPVTISLFGNNFNLRDTTNATTEYRWDVTGLTFASNQNVALQYKQASASSFSNFTGSYQENTLISILTFLNTLGIGNFTTYIESGSTYISTYNDDYVFGNLTIDGAVTASIINTSFVVGTGFNNGLIELAIQPDGKVICIGAFTSYNGTPAAGIIRLNTDGSVDPTFVYGTGFTPAGASPNTLAIQADGKIILSGAFAGISYNGSPVGNPFRINANGSIDGTYTQGAISTITNNAANDISIQSDGKAVFVGTTLPAPYIFRIDTLGVIDATFVTGTGFNLSTQAIDIQLDQKIIVGGFFSSYDGNAANDFARINTNGSFDATFSSGTGIGGGQVYDLAIQSDQKIIVVGQFSSYNGNSVNDIVRINTNGSIDVTFNSGTGFVGLCTSVIIQTDGKIILAGGFTSYNGVSANSIIRLNSDGSVDTSWNYGTGFNNTTIAMDTDLATSTLVAGGDFTSFDGQPYNRIISLNQ
jgi:uncharacterized delta-60 repeat protein